MKKLLFLLMFLPLSTIAQVKVKGYVKKDGTYVQPHVRTKPDGYKYNNYSSYGNINPYTGKSGTKGSPSNYQQYNFGTNASSGSYSYKSTTKEYEKDNSITNDDYNLYMVYFSKEGSEFYEVFSIKNNTSYDVNRIKVRLMYYVDGECVDYRDVSLDGTIPAGLTKKFELRSFDQKQKFVYHKSTRFDTDYYTKFSVRMKPLQYFKCY